jgi:hypothetical protein
MMAGEYEKQMVVLTRAAAMEKVSRAIMDFEDWTKESAADLSRKIVKELGFE